MQWLFVTTLLLCTTEFAADWRSSWHDTVPCNCLGRVDSAIPVWISAFFKIPVAYTVFPFSSLYCRVNLLHNDYPFSTVAFLLQGALCSRAVYNIVILSISPFVTHLHEHFFYAPLPGSCIILLFLHKHISTQFRLGQPQRQH